MTRRACPTCSGEVAAKGPEDSPAFPFCSDRCRMVDLGRWFAEDYRISRPLEMDDVEDSDLPLRGGPDDAHDV